MPNSAAYPIEDCEIIRFWRKVDIRGKDECWLWKPSQSTSGYGAMNHGDGCIEYSHRIAWRVTHGPIPGGMFVCHRCDVRRCCNPDHLFLGSHSDNMADAVLKGRMPRGEKKAMAKLADADIPVICEKYASGMTGRAIAMEYGVCDSLISAIVLGKRWKHIPRVIARAEGGAA